MPVCNFDKTSDNKLFRTTTRKYCICLHNLCSHFMNIKEEMFFFTQIFWVPPKEFIKQNCSKMLKVIWHYAKSTAAGGLLKAKWVHVFEDAQCYLTGDDWAISEHVAHVWRFSICWIFVPASHSLISISSPQTHMLSWPLSYHRGLYGSSSDILVQGSWVEYPKASSATWNKVRLLCAQWSLNFLLQTCHVVYGRASSMRSALACPTFPVR